MKMFFRMNKVARMYDIVRNVVIPALYSRWDESKDKCQQSCNVFSFMPVMKRFRMYADVAPDDLFNLLY